MNVISKYAHPATTVIDGGVDEKSILNALADFGWTDPRVVKYDDFLPSKIIGGGNKGVANPSGDRRIYAKVENGSIVASFGSKDLLSTAINTDETAQQNAKRFDGAVNAIDPFYRHTTEQINEPNYVGIIYYPNH